MLKILIAIIIEVWNKFMTMLFNLSLLVTFIGIIPLVLYIYYNFCHFNLIKIVSGCIAVLVIVHVNKSIQGGK